MKQADTDGEVERDDGTSLSRRGFLRATGAAATGAALGVGSGAAETAESTAAQQRSGTLELINATMSSLDPIAASDTASSAVTTQIFDGVLTWPDGSVPVEPVLARDYRVSNDFRTYTFTLKEGATFHNGKEVTARDFVYSYERIAASPSSLVQADILNTVGVVHDTDREGNYVPESMAVEAVDKYTLRIRIQKPFHAVLQVLANNQFAALPEGIVGDIKGYDGEMRQKEFATNSPVGAGPFTFERWQPNTEASVTAYENYHGPGPRLRRVHWQIIEDDNAVYNYAMNRNANVFTVPTPQYDQSKVTVERTDEQGRQFGTYGPLRNGETVNYLAVPTLNVFYIGFNMESVEKPARQAVAHVMNQRTIIDQVFKGRGVPAYHYTAPSVFPGGAQAYRRHARQEYPYGYNRTQIQQAQQVMRDAGYGPNNRYQFTFTIYQSETWQQTAQILRDQLSAAFIDMQIEQAPFSTLLSRIRKGNMQAFSLGWIVPWAAPDAFTKHINPATSQIGTEGIESYNNWPDTPAAQRAIDAWNRIQNHLKPTEAHREIRNEAYLTMEEANWADVANLPVYHETEERMWYDTVDIPPFGTGGSYRQKFNRTTVGGGGN